MSADNYKDIFTANGTWLNNTERNDGKVYLASNSRVSNHRLISENSVEFKTIAKIIKLEGTSNNAEEYLWLAHTANNQATRRSRTLYQLLQTGYSSVPRSEKTPLSNAENGVTANAARAGVMHVMGGNADPTNGARFWDGTDFLAWGLNSPNGTPHNKFEEYSSIRIPGQIFVAFLTAQRNRYGNSVRYGQNRYTLPATVFNDPANWVSPLETVPMANNTFLYRTSVRGNGIVATGTKGQTIFWAITQ